MAQKTWVCLLVKSGIFTIFLRISISGQYQKSQKFCHMLQVVCKNKFGQNNQERKGQIKAKCSFQDSSPQSLRKSCMNAIQANPVADSVTILQLMVLQKIMTLMVLNKKVVPFPLHQLQERSFHCDSQYCLYWHFFSHQTPKHQKGNLKLSQWCYKILCYLCKIQWHLLQMRSLIKDFRIKRFLLSKAFTRDARTKCSLVTPSKCVVQNCKPIFH